MQPFLHLAVRRQVPAQQRYQNHLRRYFICNRFHRGSSGAPFINLLAAASPFTISHRHTCATQSCQQHQPQTAICFSSTTTTIATATPSNRSNDTHDIQRYLCRETFPIGSLDANIAIEMIASIKSFTDVSTSSPKGVGMAFALLDRLAQEVVPLVHATRDENIDQQQQLQQQETATTTTNEAVFSLPTGTLHNVVNAWRMICGTSLHKTSTDLPSPRHVFESLVRWEALSEEFHSTRVPYTMIIHAAAATKDPELAEEILHHLLLETKKDIPVCPGVVSFNSVMDAWAKSRRHDAPLRAEAVLKHMMALSTSGWMEASPNVVSFNTVMLAWANSNHEMAPQRAEDLLDEMQRLGLVPDRVSYSTVLMAWSRSTKQREAPDRAYALLSRMIDWYDKGAAEARPNPHCYSAVISAYANRGDVRRAEQILSEQLQRFHATKDRAFLPNNVCFNAVIRACCNSGKPDAPQMAQAILQRMQDVAESLKESSLLPNVVSFNSVLHAWVASQDRDAPVQCEQLLQRMQNLVENGHETCQPDDTTFHAVLDCWAKASSTKDAPLKAETILKYMIKLKESGNQLVNPTIHSYNTAIQAWALSNRPDAVDRAQALFDELACQHNMAGKNHQPHLKPIPKTFGLLITAWARSKRQDGAAKAQAVFDDMMSRWKAGDTELRPQVIHYNALLDAWAKAGAPERAEQIIRQMDSSDGATPNAVSYSTVMNAWAVSGHPDAGERALALLTELIQNNKTGVGNRTKPNVHMFATLITTWGRSKSIDGAAKAQAVFDSMLEGYKNGDKDLQPNVVIVTALMDAWAKAGEPEKAEAILRQMDSLGAKPNVASYATVMNAWSLSRQINSTARIRALFEELIQKYKAGDGDLKPNVVVFGILITALGRGKSKESASKAQAIFDAMIAGYKAGSEELRPTVEVYNNLIDAWGKAGDPERSESILEDMNTGKSFGVKPNVFSYSSVMNAWILSKHPQSAERAHALYTTMSQKYQAGDMKLKPDGATFDMLITALCHSQRNDAMSKAQQVFDDMADRYRSGETILKPRVDKLSTVISQRSDVFNPRR